MSDGGRLLELKGRAKKLRSKVDAARAQAPKALQDELDAITASASAAFSSARDDLESAQVALDNLKARARLLVERGIGKDDDFDL